LNAIWHRILDGLAGMSRYLLAYGPFGLCAIALLDSAFVPLPAGPDAVMMVLSVGRPLWWVLLCALAATIGSVAGCMILYYVSRRAGRSALSRFSDAKQKRVKRLIDRYDVFSVLVASLLPPPFPFKLFVVSAGVFRFGALRFLVAITLGRAARFFLEGYVVAQYGEQVRVTLISYSWWIGLFGIGLALFAAVIISARSMRRRREANVVEARSALD
jgi:membrane protein YqaA with SNARE-associated domain